MKHKVFCSANVIICLLFTLSVDAQKKTFIESKSQIGIDITNTLTFLKKNNQSYLVNYKYYLNSFKYAIRGGLNLDIGTGESDGFYPDMKIGFQKNKIDSKWITYFGADISFLYSKSNAIDISTQRYGITPLIGVEHFLSKRISISTEAALNFHYFIVDYLNTFDPVKRKFYTNINLGYVGMFVISYHF